jgi:hypothetical protein
LPPKQWIIIARKDQFSVFLNFCGVCPKGNQLNINNNNNIHHHVKILCCSLSPLEDYSVPVWYPDGNRNLGRQGRRLSETEYDNTPVAPVFLFTDLIHTHVFLFSPNKKSNVNVVVLQVIIIIHQYIHFQIPVTLSNSATLEGTFAVLNPRQFIDNVINIKQKRNIK